MGRGRPLPELKLTAEENNRLVEWTRRHKTSQALAVRARIVLWCAQGTPNMEVASHLRVSKQMVGKWRQRFVERRLDGLLDEPRPGAPRQIGDDVVAAIVAKTLQDKPADATHWSTRSLAGSMKLSQTSVSRIWRAFGLQPHRQETFKLSTDALFVDKVRDIVGLHATRDSTRTSHRRPRPGSIRLNAGSRKSRASRFAVALIAARDNWSKPFVITWRPTT